jgi:RNA polymerase sigma-70 factor (ECF subfamily)
MVQVLESARPSRRAYPVKIPRTMSDLLQKVAQTRDVEAFRKLFELYGPRVKAYMMRQGADATTAEDLAQETLLTVWRKAGLYSDEKGSATTWIFTIARNLRIDRLRREVSWQPLPENRDEEAADGPDPEEEVTARERRDKVRAVLATLPPDQSEVVTLSYVEGLSHSEIAERLSLPLGTVKSRMRLAYQKVKEAVEDIR